jgi:hypothetical protein
MQSLFADTVSYQNGTFSLFMPSRSVIAEAQKRGTELYLPIREETQTEKIPVYQYEVGDSVFIHGLELEIDGIYPETVLLRDKSFPLMSYSYDPQQFEALLRDNPLNDHMIVEFVEQIPEQAKEADVGIAGGKGEGLLFRRGEIIEKIPEDQLIPRLIAEIRQMDRQSKG